MAFDWFRVDSSFVDHPKAMRLEVEINDPNAIAYVVRLWSWLSRFAQSGRFAPILAAHVEIACKWRGEKGALVAALCAAGLLDIDTESGDFEAHDWWEKQGAIVEKANRDAEMKRQMRRESGAKTARAEKAPKKRRPPTPGAKTARAEKGTRRDETDVTKRDETEPPNPLFEFQRNALKSAWNLTAAKAGASEWVETPADRLVAVDAALARRPLEQWQRIFAAIAADGFATGKHPGSDGRKWRADIDYAIRPGGTKPEPALKYLERAAPQPTHDPLDQRVMP